MGTYQGSWVEHSLLVVILIGAVYGLYAKEEAAWGRLIGSAIALIVVALVADATFPVVRDPEEPSVRFFIRLFLLRILLVTTAFFSMCLALRGIREWRRQRSKAS